MSFSLQFLVQHFIQFREYLVSLYIVPSVIMLLSWMIKRKHSTTTPTNVVLFILESCKDIENQFDTEVSVCFIHNTDDMILPK